MTTIHAVITVSFIYIFIIAVLYFTKKKVINRDNIYLSILLVLTLITITLELVNNIALVKYASTSLIPHKLYEISIAIWSTIFFLYSMHVVDGQSDKPTTKQTTIVKAVTVSIYTIVICVLLFMFESKVKFSGIFPYEHGSAVTFLIVMNFLYIIFEDIYMFMNEKKEFRKLLPIIFYQLLFAIYVITRTYIVSPGYTVFIPVISLVVLIMVNTIENTDLKIITELDAARQETEKATRAKSDFLSSMSHEIRTPLNAIVGLSELISEENNISDDIREYLDDINNASQTLLDIVGNILDINKIESNKMEIQNMNYMPTELAAELLRVNKVRIGSKKIELISNISPDVPYELVGDKIHIKQIVNNLLSNAIKYTDEGSVTLNMAAQNDGFVCNLIIQVIDTGKGIKSSDFDKLFNKFERLDTEINSTINGSGLGLAITKKLVELLNGTIRVNSTYGKGSTFEVTIPQSISMMMNPSQVALEYQIEQIENEGAIEQNKRKQLLLVDDSQINLRIASGYLKGFDVVIDTATTGKEAIEKVKSKVYDLIFLDLKMPTMDGFKTLDEMKLINGFNTPVVAFTAVEEDVEATCLNAGFKGFLIKPFTKEQLVKKINSVLGIVLRGSEIFDEPKEEEKETPLEEAPVVDIPIINADDTSAVPDSTEVQPVVEAPVETGEKDVPAIPVPNVPEEPKTEVAMPTPTVTPTEVPTPTATPVQPSIDFDK